MNDRISEFSQNLAPQSDVVQFRQEKGQGIHVPFIVYFIGFLVFITFVAVQVNNVAKKDDKKGGSGGSNSFGGSAKK